MYEYVYIYIYIIWNYNMYLRACMPTWLGRMTWLWGPGSALPTSPYLERRASKPIYKHGNTCLRIYSYIYVKLYINLYLYIHKRMYREGSAPLTSPYWEKRASKPIQKKDMYICIHIYIYRRSTYMVWESCSIHI
jgi:hypothetical protein